MDLRQIKITLSFAVLALVLAGCPKEETVAYRTAVGAKAFLDNVKSKHPECDNLANTMPVCQALRRATAAKDILIDAGEVYCGGAQFESGGPCNAPQKGTPAQKLALDKLNAAVSQWKQFDADLRAALSK